MSNFHGTLPLLNLIFRKDRFKIFIWLLCIVSITLFAAGAYPTIYKHEDDIQGFALTMKNPAMEVMLGPGYELEDYTSTAQIFANEMLLFTLIAIAVMNILIIGKTTRDDEETGKLELILSLPVGKHSYLGASIIEGIFINIVLTIFVTIGLYSLRIDGIDFEGAFLYACLLGATGLVFSGITACFAQLVETSRGSTSMALTFLIIAYLIRGIGDVEVEGLSYLSPFGWASRAYVFVDNHWWPVIISSILTSILFILSLFLNQKRDLGAGFLPARKGKEHANPFILTPLGFIIRQQRMMIFAWAIGLLLLSASFGSIMGDLETYFSDLDIMEAFLNEQLAVSMGEQFAVLTISIISLFSTIPVILSMLKLKGEESRLRTEHFYSRAVSRTKLISSYYVASIIASILMQLAIALGFVAVLDTSTTLNTSIIFKATFSFLPAIWLISAIVVLFIGVTTKITNTIWLYIGFCFIILYLKELLQFPDWLNHISVFEHIPKIPIEDFTWTPLIVMTMLAGIISLVGILFYNKRDILG